MYRGNFVIESANEVEIMNLAVVVLLMVYISLCVVVIGGWAFKTLDDDVIPDWDDSDDEQGNLL